jgi:hypothetical protein
MKIMRRESGWDIAAWFSPAKNGGRAKKLITTE